MLRRNAYCCTVKRFVEITLYKSTRMNTLKFEKPMFSTAEKVIAGIGGAWSFASCFLVDWYSDFMQYLFALGTTGSGGILLLFIQKFGGPLVQDWADQFRPWFKSKFRKK